MPLPQGDALLAYAQLVYQDSPDPSLKSCFPASQSPVCTGAWGYSSPGASPFEL